MGVMESAKTTTLIKTVGFDRVRNSDIREERKLQNINDRIKRINHE